MRELTAEEVREAVREHCAYAIANDIERAIAGLGYPVGCGVAPHPDVCRNAANAIINRIGDRAYLIMGGASPTPRGEG